MPDPALPDNDRAERARSGRGSLAYLAKGRPSVVEELIAERRAEAAGETTPLDGRPVRHRTS